MERMKPQHGRQLRRGHPLSRNVRGCWLFNGCGPITTDLSGNGINGTLLNGAIITTGKFGSAVRFAGDASDDHIYFGHPNLVNGAAQMSVVAWVRSDVGLKDVTNYVIEQGNTAGNRVFYMRWDNGENVDFLVYNSSASSATGRDTDGITDANWHQLVGVYDGANVYVYVDTVVGETVGTLSGVLDTDASVVSDGLVIGASLGSTGTVSNEWLGEIDHVIVFNTALSQSFINSLYIDPFQMFEGCL